VTQPLFSPKREKRFRWRERREGEEEVETFIQEEGEEMNTPNPGA